MATSYKFNVFISSLISKYSESILKFQLYGDLTMLSVIDFSFIILWSDNMVCTILMFWCLLRLVSDLGGQFFKLFHVYSLIIDSGVLGR